MGEGCTRGLDCPFDLQVFKLRTVPAKYLTDFDSGKQLFFLIKAVSSTTTYYWVTSSATFSLWPNTVASHGGSALTKDAGQITWSIDGQEEFGIGTVETGIDIEHFGGGVGETGDFEFRILNQDGISTTLNSQTFNNRSVELRMGFVDTTNGTGVNDMLLIGSFIVDNAEMFDWGRFVFRCVDPLINMDKELPIDTITKELYPNAPDESLGKSIPALYGDFQTFNTMDSASNRYKEKYDIAPTVITSFGKFSFGAPSHTIAKHNVVSINEIFYVANDLVGVIQNSLITENGSGVAGIDMLSTFIVGWNITATEEGTVGPGVTEDIANQFIWSNDRDLDTAYTMTGNSDVTLRHLYFVVAKIGDGVLRPVDGYKIAAFFGTISASTQIRHSHRNVGAGTILDFGTADSTDSDTLVIASTTLPVGMTWDDFRDDLEYGFRIQNITAEIQHFSIEVFSQVSKKYGILPPKPVGHGFRPGTKIRLIGRLGRL